MSIRKIFEEELSQLKTELVEMCRLTEQMISDAIEALVNRDRELGKVLPAQISELTSTKWI